MVSPLLVGGLGQTFGQGLRNEATRGFQVRGLEQRKDLAQQELGLRQKQIDAQSTSQMVQNLNTLEKNLFKSLTDSAKNAGFDSQAVQQLVQATTPQYAKLIMNRQRALGNQIDQNQALRQAQQRIQSAVVGQTAEQAGAAKGRAAVAEQGAIGDALGGAQFEVIPTAQFNAQNNAQLPPNTVIQKDNLTGELKIKVPGAPLVQVTPPSIDPQGNVTAGAGTAGTAGGKSGIPTLPGKALDNIRAQANSTENSLKVVDNLITQARENPQIFGTVGAGRKAVQTAGGIVADAFNVLGLDMRGAFDSLQQTLGLDDIAEDAKRDLAPTTVGALDVFDAQLTYAMARALQPEGRLLKDAVTQARKQINLLGLFSSSTQVAERLEAVRSQLGARQSFLQRRMQQGVQGETNIPKESPVPGGSVNIDDLIKDLEGRITGGGTI